MKFKKIFYLPGMLAISFLLLAANPVWSGVEGGGVAPTDWEKVVGPELWAVVVIHCGLGKDFGVIRVKGVFDCDVKTQTLVDLDTFGLLGCINDQSKFLYERFPRETFFFGQEGAPTVDGKWIITKIKHYKFDTVGDSTIISFDAQIKFEKLQ